MSKVRKLIRQIKRILLAQKSIAVRNFYKLYHLGALRVPLLANMQLGGLRLADVKSVRYCAENQQSFGRLVVENIEISVNGETETVVSPACIFPVQEEESHKVATPDLYICELRDVHVIGSSDYLVAPSSGLLLNDRAEINSKSLAHYNPGLIKNIVTDSFLVDVSVPARTIEKGIHLSSRWTGNIYHFMYDSLARLSLVDQVKQYEDYPIVVDQSALRDSRSRCLLAILNINNRPLIEVGRNELVAVKRLVYPSPVAWSLPYQGYSLAGVMIRNTVTDMRKKVLSKTFSSTEVPVPSRKVFIERGNNNRLVNESDVSCFFADHGYEIINTDSLSLEDEIRLFAESRCIVTTFGAALAHGLYCGKNAVIVSICPAEFSWYVMYANIAAAVGAKYYNMNAKITERWGNPINCSRYQVDIRDCKEFIRKFDLD